MIRARELGWLAAGFALATIVCALFGPIPARAQQLGGFDTTITPAPKAQPLPPRRVNAVPIYEDAPRPRQAGTGAVVPAADAQETADSDADGTTDGSRPDAGRAARGDGDPEPMEPDPVLDGVIDTAEPIPAADGVDPARNDARSPEDVAAFEQPPAGFDPRLFDAEIEPILDRRPARLFRFEPYQPTGIKAGSFALFPEVEIGTTWTSNVFLTSSPHADRIYDIRPTVRLVSNWRTHALEFRATGLASHYAEFSSEDQRAYTLEARGRLDVAKRTSIEALAYHDLAQESRSSINAPRDEASPSDITTDRVAATFNHRFNRLSVQLRGSLTSVSYSPVTAVDGSLISNTDRNNRTAEEIARLTWEFKPALLAFVEAGLNQRRFEAASVSDGIRRDSTGDRTRVGLSFGNTGNVLRGEVSVGWARQRPDDSRLEDIAGVIVDANLAYRYDALTTFMLTARSDVTDSSIAGSGGALSRQVGLEARHAFQRRLIGSAGLAYTVQDYQGVGIDERELRSTLGLEYFISREMMLFGRYQHAWLDSTDSSRNYNSDEVRIGLRIRR